MREVVVTTGARLHFGLFELVPGCEFGGIGMMIDQPGVRVRATKSESIDIIAPEAITSRVKSFVDRVRTAFDSVPAARVEVTSFIPSHHGLGSGTQLALAIGTALAKLGSVDCTASDIARATGRGVRSAIGIHGFESGGFLIDAGHLPGSDLGRVTERYDIPDDWRIVLITPNDSDGLSGASEVEAFQQLPAMTQAMKSELRACVSKRLCPALEVADFDAFALSLDEFGRTIGEYFSPVQGGILRSPQAREVSASLRERGVKAIVQSSWGPTICAIVPNEVEANHVQSERNVSARIVRPLNRGARIDHS